VTYILLHEVRISDQVAIPIIYVRRPIGAENLIHEIGAPSTVGNIQAVGELRPS
jgi:hypothetical protein